MAELLAAGGQAIGSGISTFGQGLQSAAGGNLMPLMGDMLPKPVTGLIDTVMAKNDPTKDPYKPEQPIVYDADGNLKKPEPNPYAGLLSAMSKPPEKESNFVDKAPPAPMPTVVRTVQTSQVDPSKKLRQQAFGVYR